MIKRIAISVLILIEAISCAYAQGTIKPKASILTEIPQQLPDNITGAISPSNARTVFTDIVNSTQQAPQVNSQIATSYTVGLADYGKLVTLNNSAPVTVTLPTPTGSLQAMNVFIANTGAGIATISVAAGGTINSVGSITIQNGGFVWFVSDGGGSNYQAVNQTANNNVAGYCVIDGITFAATTGGVQAAINNTNCKDIYIPAGTYNGTAQITIARNNIRLHGASGIGDNSGNSFGTNGSTLINFTSCVAGNSVQIGDASAAHTWNGISIEDISIVIPASCTTNAVDIKLSAAGVSGLFRRVRITTPGSTGGTGVNLESGVFGWQFEDVTVDHWGTGYNFAGSNHFTRVTGGQCNNNTVCAQTTTTSSQNITFIGVDVEGNTSYGFDIQNSQGFVIQNCYIDNNASAAARAIRVGAGAATAPEGVTVIGTLFNGGTANYAIELASNGFTGLHIIGDHFNSYVTGNVLNNSGANGTHGIYIGNDNFYTGAGAELSATAGFDLVNFQQGAFSNGYLMNLVRPSARGSGLVPGNISLSAGWGSTAAATLTAVSRDTIGEVNITPNGTGIALGPTFTVTFVDGTFGSSPFCLAGNSGNNFPVARVSSRSATQVTIAWDQTPTAGSTVSFTWMCWGNN